MANIRVDINHAPRDGETVTFKAPCDAKEITGLVLYYVDDDKATKSRQFTLSDANGGDIGVLENIFSAGALVKVLLDTGEGKAFMQNADTNAYLEDKLAEKYSPENKPTAGDIEFTDGMTFQQKYDSGELKGDKGDKGDPGYTPQKGVDYFDGKDGQNGAAGKDGVSATHSWNGTVLSITSASGTSSADLKGDKGDPYTLTDTDKNSIAAAVRATMTAADVGAGTFGGQVVANADGQAAGTSLLRNSKLVSAETNPTVNGEICWTYK